LHQDPIKSIHFSSSNPLCHAFDPEAKDGHDLLVGVFSGDGILNASYFGMLDAYKLKVNHV
jgi:hypothetical protein